METHVFKMAAKFRDQRTWMNAHPQVLMLTPYRMSEPLDGDKSIAAPCLFGKNAANSISSRGVMMGNTCFQDGGQIQRQAKHIHECRSASMVPMLTPYV
jgi:hypothetical protein